MNRSMILVLFTLCVIVATVSNGLSADTGSGTVQSEVYEALEHDDTVRVYITFNSDRETHRRLFRESAQDVRDVVGKDSIKYDYGDRISATITHGELEQLEKNPGVAKIQKVGVRKIMLQSSAALVNATHAAPLQVDGINLTGAGQTICIIDTGINYSHESLGGCYGNSSASSSCKVWGGWDYCADNSGCTTQDEIPDDVHGHGTHVAGIAAGNNRTRGVAPDARIVMLKACRSSDGTCSDDDINKSIYWCIGNRTALNISVISMSLGSDPSTDGYCNNDALAASINEAVGVNITVVIAAGNNGNTTGISAPACVQNATAIGSIQKDDATFNYNRNNITLLVAPGYQINSTAVGGGYTTLSGTSMAAPHAAGAVAILAQYINLTGRQRTPAQIVSTLNSTGRRVNDAGSNWNYSRINIYDAIISLDATVPTTALVSPSNATSSLEVNQTFRCNATDLALRNATLFVWNSSGSILNQSSRSTSGGSAALEFNASNLSRGEHQWNCLFADENNNAAFAGVNRTVTIADLTASLVSPPSGALVRANDTLICNSTTTATLSNSTLFIWNSTGSQINITVQNISGTLNRTNFTYHFASEGTYTWNCLFKTGTNLEQFASSNASITYDVTNPRANITEPANKTWQNKANFNVSMNENGSCIASLDGGIRNVSLSSTNNRAFNGTNATLVHGVNYTAAYYCNDSAGNLNASTLQAFTVDLTAPNITLLAPNVSYNLTADSTTVVFNYSIVDEINVTSCSFIVNGAVNQTNSTIANLTANQSFTATFAAGNFNWSINCTDEAGNGGNSSGRSMVLTAVPVSSTPASSGGGGGGGGGGGAALTTATTYRPSFTDVQQGYTRTLKPSDSIKVAVPVAVGGGSGSGGGTTSGGGATSNVPTQEHTVTVDNVTATSAQITVRSEPIKLVLQVGEQARLNLTSATMYDLLVKLESIVNASASITVKTIAEPIPPPSTGAGSSGNSTGVQQEQNTTALAPGQEETSKQGRYRWIKYLLIALVLCLIAAISGYLLWYWRVHADVPWAPPSQRSE